MLWVGVVIEMCEPLENGTEEPRGVGDILLICLLALYHVMEAIITDYTRLHNQTWQHGHVYSANTTEALFKGVVMCYLLVSDNAVVLPCKHHENGSENATKVCILPEASLCKLSLNISDQCYLVCWKSNEDVHYLLIKLWGRAQTIIH